MKIVIFGASGLMGTKLMEKLISKHEVIGTYFKNPKKGLFAFNATSEGEAKTFLKKHKPDLIINTIALTSSVLCQKDPLLAKKYNYQTAKNISLVCKELGVPLVFISSSYVFDGKEGDYLENEVPSPITIYGRTKLLAEKEALKVEENIVLRVDAIYGFNGRNKNNGILGKIISGEEIFLGGPDQIRQPLLIDDLAGIIIALINGKERGIFNVAGPDKISMLDFIKKLEGLVRQGSKVSILEEKNLLVKPKKNTSLNIKKINELGIKTTTLEEGLKRIKEQLK